MGEEGGEVREYRGEEKDIGKIETIILPKHL